MQPVAIIRAAAQLGEGILWDGERVWWTDIEGRTLHSFDWAEQCRARFTTPERLASFGLVADSDLMIGAFESGFALFHPAEGLKTPIQTPRGLSPGLRLNDGRVDRQGRFWAGAMVEAPDACDSASLYCVAARNIGTRESGHSISNGICWSPDSKWFYFADSARRTIWRYGFDAESGRIFAPEVFAVTPQTMCPDGAAMDAAGFLWSAQWDGGCVIRYAPDGRIDRVIELPVSRPTCVAFGGPDLDLLFVTTARVGLSEDALRAQSGAGDVFVYNVKVRGLPESRFKLDGWPPDAF